MRDRYDGPQIDLILRAAEGRVSKDRGRSLRCWAYVSAYAPSRGRPNCTCIACDAAARRAITKGSGAASGRTCMMASDRRIEELRRATNPVFNDRALKLGTFGTNLDRGCAISTIDRVLEINWPNTLELARISEEM